MSAAVNVRTSDHFFWSVVYSIMGYAIDAVSRLNIDIGENRATLDGEIFLSNLYVKREDDQFEEQLINSMVGSPHLVCFVGGRGSGKTSTLHYAVHEIRTRYPDIKPLHIDIKTIYEQDTFKRLTPDSAAQLFRRALRQRVQNELFPSPKETREFLAWALAGPPDSTDNFECELLADLHDHFIDAQAWAHIGDELTRQQRKIALESFFLTHQEIEYREIYKACKPDLRMAHLIQAAIRLTGWRKVLLVYDNVDRIPGDYQSYFFEVVNDSQISMGGICTTTIAIREENT